MFFVKNLRNGEIKEFRTPTQVATYMLGRLRGSHEIHYSPAVIEFSDDKPFDYYAITRALRDAEAKYANQ